MNPSTSTARMSSLIPAATDRPGDDPIFAINALAQRRIAAGGAVINASLGALLEDDGRLAILPTVDETMRSIAPRSAAAYAPIAGDEPFLRAIVQDSLGTGALAERAVAVATAGGTGAIHHAIVNFVESGQSLLTTSYYWSPYGIIAEHTGRSVETFEMYDDGGCFHLAALESALGSQLERQGRALLVLNFPCHNPTGYSLDGAEWEALAGVLTRASRHGSLVLLLDLAYARYGDQDFARWVGSLTSLSASCTLLLAWSASKAFLQYGSRVGGLIAVVQDEEERTSVSNALSYSCRGTWSNCNHRGILAITELLTDPELAARADLERDRLKDMLGERVALFNREAAGTVLRYPRYEGGFFVAVFTPDARRTAELAAEEDVFVVPMEGAVRVALCSTPASDVPRLVEVLARAVDAVS
ncbi:MAG: aminotransferase class I/II-fold pyridoxal phosphate-dependent enzyme [Planctomycetota bacterium]